MRLGGYAPTFKQQYLRGDSIDFWACNNFFLAWQLMKFHIYEFFNNCFLIYCQQFFFSKNQHRMYRRVIIIRTLFVRMLYVETYNKKNYSTKWGKLSRNISFSVMVQWIFPQHEGVTKKGHTFGLLKTLWEYSIERKAGNSNVNIYVEV